MRRVSFRTRRNGPLQEPQADPIALSFVPKSNQWAQLPSAQASRPEVPQSLDDERKGSQLLNFLRRGFDRPRIQGWKAGAISSATVAAIVLLINIVAVIWLQRHPSEDGTLVELFRGNCDRVETMTVWSHLLINAAGTVLLSGSNYCMQVLASPTRQEIDRAHARKIWLDIGVPSVRNIWRISPYRAIIWWALGLSSIPLHLLYNSAFYASIGAANYRIDFVTPAYRNESVGNLPEESFKGIAPPPARDDYVRADNCASNSTCRNEVKAHLHHLQNDGSSKLEKLSLDQCVTAYAQPLLTARSNLIIVTSNNSVDRVLQADYTYSLSNNIDLIHSSYFPFEWICSSSDRLLSHHEEFSKTLWDRPICEAWVSSILADASQWTPMDYDVDFCLSEVIEQRCSFSGNISILLVVIACNVVKIICMLFTAFGIDGNTPLITVGDAIASFMQRPDPLTRESCLWARRDVQDNSSLIFVTDDNQKPKVAKHRRRRWKAAASAARWAWTLFFLGLAIIVVMGLAIAASMAIAQHDTPLSALGFGRIHPSALVNGWGIAQIPNSKKQIIAAILVANFPQTILSFLYLNLNGLVTSIWLSMEWLSYASTRRALRVSKPSGDQRMTFFLQLPYKVGIPLMVFSGVMHWLVSQSFFLAVIAEYDWDGNLLDSTALATCGYSLVPMLAAMSLGVGIWLGLVFVARSRFDGTGPWSGMMPLAGSCSAAISAACHRPEWDHDADAKPMMWGAVESQAGAEQGQNVGHCTFTSGPVVPVVEGKRYA